MGQCRDVGTLRNSFSGLDRAAYGEGDPSGQHVVGGVGDGPVGGERRGPQHEQRPGGGDLCCTAIIPVAMGISSRQNAGVGVIGVGVRAAPATSAKTRRAPVSTSRTAVATCPSVNRPGCARYKSSTPNGTAPICSGNANTRGRARGGAIHARTPATARPRPATSGQVRAPARGAVGVLAGAFAQDELQVVQAGDDRVGGMHQCCGCIAAPHGHRGPVHR